MDEVYVGVHAGVGIPGAEIHVKDTNFLESERLHCLIFLAEVITHLRVCIFGLDGDKAGLIGFTDNLTVLDTEMDLTAGKEACVAAGVHKDYRVTFFHKRTVVVAADDKIGPSHAVKNIQCLSFRVIAVSCACGGMNAQYNHVRMLFCTDIVHILLNAGSDTFKVHSAPELLSQPGVDVGVLISKHGNLKTTFLYYCIEGEVGFSVVIADSITGKKGYAVGLHLTVYAVVDLMASLYVMVPPHHSIVVHIVKDARKKMGREGVYIVIIVCGVVTLQAVSGINENDIILAIGLTYAVYVRVDGAKGILDPAAYVGGIKPGSVDVVGGEHREGVVSVLGTTCTGEKRKAESRDDECADFHMLLSSES